MDSAAMGQSGWLLLWVMVGLLLLVGIASIMLCARTQTTIRPAAVITLSAPIQIPFQIDPTQPVPTIIRPGFENAFDGHSHLPDLIVGSPTCWDTHSHVICLGVVSNPLPIGVTGIQIRVTRHTSQGRTTRFITPEQRQIPPYSSAPYRVFFEHSPPRAHSIRTTAILHEAFLAEGSASLEVASVLGAWQPDVTQQGVYLIEASIALPDVPEISSTIQVIAMLTNTEGVLVGYRAMRTSPDEMAVQRVRIPIIPIIDDGPFRHHIYAETYVTPLMNQP